MDDRGGAWRLRGEWVSNIRLGPCDTPWIPLSDRSRLPRSPRSHAGISDVNCCTLRSCGEDRNRESRKGGLRCGAQCALSVGSAETRLGTTLIEKTVAFFGPIAPRRSARNYCGLGSTRALAQ